MSGRRQGYILKNRRLEWKEDVPQTESPLAVVFFASSAFKPSGGVEASIASHHFVHVHSIISTDSSYGNWNVKIPIVRHVRIHIHIA